MERSGPATGSSRRRTEGGSDSEEGNRVSPPIGRTRPRFRRERAEKCVISTATLNATGAAGQSEASLPTRRSEAIAKRR